MIVSVTRLRLRSLLYFPPFIWHALRSAKQARSAPGFVGGWLGGEDMRSNWTATVWESMEAMRAFRNSGAHLTAMPRLMHWCDESSYVHWEQEETDVPTPEAAYARLVSSGKLSKVLQPSAQQQAGQMAGEKKPRTAQRLIPSKS